MVFLSFSLVRMFRHFSFDTRYGFAFIHAV